MSFIPPSEQVQRRLRAAGAHSKKHLGQHFLTDLTVIDRMIEGAHLGSNELVVEIGPGMGVLSRPLLATGARVTALELDEEMINILAEDVPELSVVQGNALETFPGVVNTFTEPYSVIANIPYAITTPLIELLLQKPDVAKPRQALLLVQKELAERLVAKAGTSNRSFLSTVVELYCATATIIVQVPARSFTPPPKVESAVIALVPRTEALFPDIDSHKLLKFMRMAFIQRRKQLKNVLAGIRGTDGDTIERVFTEVGLKPTARSQELTMLQWAQLYRATNG